MDAKHRLALARKYVEWSNLHRPDRLTELLDEFAIYRSDLVGDISGRAAIGEMFELFFERYPNIKWNVSGYTEGPAESVEFDFIMKTTHPDTDDEMERHGTERLAFTDRGLIRQVTVTGRDWTTD